MARSNSALLGRGRAHSESRYVLPPTLSAGAAMIDMISKWVTAEVLVGNLDELRERENESAARLKRNNSPGRSR